MMRLQIAAFALAFLAIAMPSFAWYDANYLNRTQVTVTNNAGSGLTQYLMTMNSSATISTAWDSGVLISRGRMQAQILQPTL